MTRLASILRISPTHAWTRVKGISQIACTDPSIYINENLLSCKSAFRNVHEKEFSIFMTDINVKNTVSMDPSVKQTVFNWRFCRIIGTSVSDGIHGQQEDAFSETDWMKKKREKQIYIYTNRFFWLFHHHRISRSLSRERFWLLQRPWLGSEKLEHESDEWDEFEKRQWVYISGVIAKWLCMRHWCFSLLVSLS